MMSYKIIARILNSLPKKIIFSIYSYCNEFFITLLNLFPPIFRTLIFKLIFKKFGRNSFIDYHIYFRYPRKIEIGNNVEINRGFHAYPSFFTPNAYIRIGNNVIIAPNVHIYGAGQDPNNVTNHIAKNIVIGDHSYIGADSIIRYGVEIGSNCIVGAGSVVVSDVPQGSVVAGNPARTIQK
jgi:acetyltransferase-like isoleucine patch superfamily enzyme